MNKTRPIYSALLWAVCFAFPGALLAQGSEPITLKQAIGLALENSRELALARARQTVAANAAGVSRSAFRPNLYTGSGAAYTYGFPQTPSGAAPSIINLSYVQTIFNPSLRGQASEAGERTEIQRLEVERTRNAVVLQTTSAYLELAKVRHSLDLMRQERQSGMRIVDFTRQRVTEGLELKIAVTREEVAVAKIDARIVKLEGRQRVLEQQMAALMGIPADRSIELDSETLALNEEPREQDLIRRALETNTDVRQAEYERRARERRLAGEIGAKWPTVDLVGEYGLFSRINNFDDYFRKFQRNNFNIGIQVRIPILSADRSAKVTLARSELSVAEMELRNKRQNLELEIGRQYQRVRELDAARKVAQLELTLAQENLQVIQAGYEEGRINLRDDEKARLEENDKWLAFLDSDFERQKAKLELLNTTGELSRLF